MCGSGDRFKINYDKIKAAWISAIVYMRLFACYRDEMPYDTMHTLLLEFEGIVMITLHHLNRSRSQRIIWLLEELGVEYKIKAYQRDSVTSLAPDSLKAVHPLGKSPVIEDNGMVVAESGAITEYLIATYGNGKIAAPKDSAEAVQVSQWIHFAESSAMLPLLLKLFIMRDGGDMNFLPAYANSELAKILGYFNACLDGKIFLVGDTLTGADIMMSFIVQSLQNSGMIKAFPNIERYSENLETIPAYNKAKALEAEHDATVA